MSSPATAEQWVANASEAIDNLSLYSYYGNASATAASSSATGHAANFNDSCVQDLSLEDGLTEFILYGLLLNAISLLGLIGNTISVIVLSRPQMRSSINYLLIGLATCDTVLILLSVLVYGLPGLYAYTGYMFEYKFYVYPKIVRYLYPLSTTAQMATVYITLTVTMERYVAVCHPLKARSLCTHGRARTALLIIGLLSLLYNLPKLWEVELDPQWHPKYNVTVYCIQGSELRLNPLYITVYVHWAYFFVYYAFPFVALVIFNMAIYKRVRKANRDRRRLSRNQRREIGLATMLLCVVIVFLVCNLLPLASNVCENLYASPPLTLVQLGNLLVTFNSGVNFVIYVIFGRKFKRIFLRIFCHVTRDYEIGRPGYRADSPDFQTCNEDSVATNTTHIELRNSIRRNQHSLNARPQGGSTHLHNPHQNQNLHSGQNGYSLRSSVYYPSSPSKHNGNTQPSNHVTEQEKHRLTAGEINESAGPITFC